MPEPENFGIYRQQQLDNDLLSTYSTADGVRHMAKRFTMKKFLQLSDEDILVNERLKAEELGLDPDAGKANFAQIYGPPPDEMGGMMGGGLGGSGMMAGQLGGAGEGLEGGMDPSADMAGGEMGMPTAPISPGNTGAPPAE